MSRNALWSCGRVDRSRLVHHPARVTVVQFFCRVQSPRRGGRKVKQWARPERISTPDVHSQVVGPLITLSRGPKVSGIAALEAREQMGSSDRIHSHPRSPRKRVRVTDGSCATGCGARRECSVQSEDRVSCSWAGRQEGGATTRSRTRRPRCRWSRIRSGPFALVARMTPGDVTSRDGIVPPAASFTGVWGRR